MSRSNWRLISFQNPYLESPAARSAWSTGTSAMRLAKLLARAGMKLERSLHSSIASTISRR